MNKYKFMAYILSLMSICNFSKSIAIDKLYFHDKQKFEKAISEFKEKKEWSINNFKCELETNGKLIVKGNGKVENIFLDSGEDVSILRALVTEITFKGDITEIGVGAFAHCERLQKIDIPDSVKSFGSAAFMGCCNLQEIKITNDNVKSNPNGMCSDCWNLQRIAMPSSIKSIGNGAFGCCGMLEELKFNNIDENNKFPKSLERIGDHAFSTCKFSKININSVKYIGDEAFINCRSLHEVIIDKDNTLDYVGNKAFAGCINLPCFNQKQIKAKKIGNNIFENCIQMLNFDNITKAE